jgi:hypothetical protein
MRSEVSHDINGIRNDHQDCARRMLDDRRHHLGKYGGISLK